MRRPVAGVPSAWLASGSPATITDRLWQFSVLKTWVPLAGNMSHPEFDGDPELRPDFLAVASLLSFDAKGSEAPAQKLICPAAQLLRSSTMRGARSARWERGGVGLSRVVGALDD
jgi:hypothetical protein